MRSSFPDHPRRAVHGRAREQAPPAQTRTPDNRVIVDDWPPRSGMLRRGADLVAQFMIDAVDPLFGFRVEKTKEAWITSGSPGVNGVSEAPDPVLNDHSGPAACAYVRASQADQGASEEALAREVAAIEGWCAQAGVRLAAVHAERR